MKSVLFLAVCVLFAGCTDGDRDARIAKLEISNAWLSAQYEREEAAIAELNKQSAAIKSDADRFRMFNSKPFGPDAEMAFLYDSKTGRVWRYFRNYADDHKTIADEGFGLMMDPSSENQTTRKPASFDPASAVPAPPMPWQK